MEGKRRGEREAQSISPFIDQLMCCSRDFISQETDEETEGKKKKS